jgi:hypothetical protein
MSYVESVFINPEEFEANKENRLQEVELVEKELYIVMFALASVVEHRQAVKAPVQFEKIEDIEAVPHTLEITYLKLDLTPSFTRDMRSYDGYMSDPKLTLSFKDTETDEYFKVKLGYFKPYASDPDFGPQEVTTYNEIPNQELALV